MLPYQDLDKQQLERKRHLGNDVCMVIFRELGCQGKAFSLPGTYPSCC